MAAGTRIDSRIARSSATRRAEIERPLLFLEKADAFGFRRCRFDGLARRLLIGDGRSRPEIAMLIGEASRFQRDHDLARCRRATA